MLNSKEMDAQSQVTIDRWINVDSEEAKRIMKYPQFMRDILRLSICETDDLGRLWGKGNAGYYPLHDEYQGKLIGWKIIRLAAN